jgi:hypothetical protein
MTNAVYKAALAEWKARPARSAHVGTTDTAKAIRALLKRKFPTTKFSVRSKIYAGGSSIDVSWTDGPTAKLVDAYIAPFAGSGFDGMCDMKYNVGAWLYPNGEAAFRETRGTEGNGVVPAAAAGPDYNGAVPVSFGADFVFTNRSLSEPAKDRVLKAYAAKWNDELADAIRAGEVTEFHHASRFKSAAPVRAPHMADCYLYEMAARRMMPDAMPAIEAA